MEEKEKEEEDIIPTKKSQISFITFASGDYVMCHVVGSECRSAIHICPYSGYARKICVPFGARKDEFVDKLQIMFGFARKTEDADALLGSLNTPKRVCFLFAQSDESFCLPNGEPVFLIKRSWWVEIKLSSLFFMQEATEETKKMNLIHKYKFDDGTHYYCLESDITRPYPSAHCMCDPDNDFVWNRVLRNSWNEDICPAVIRGFCTKIQNTEGASGCKYDISMVVRRSCGNPGAQQSHHGFLQGYECGENLDPANEYEVDVVIERSDVHHWKAFTMRRGTIPCFFSKDGRIASHHACGPQMGLYFDRVARRISASDVFVLSLLRLKKSEDEELNILQKLAESFRSLFHHEDKLSAWFEDHVHSVNSDTDIRLRFCAFDWLEEVKSGTRHALEKLWAVTSDFVRRCGCRADNSPSALGPSGFQQRGLFRVNCFDALDRTNIVSCFLTVQWIALAVSEFEQKSISDSQLSSLEQVRAILGQTMIDLISEAFDECGDRIAMMYAYSDALHSEHLSVLSGKDEGKDLMSHYLTLLERRTLGVLSDTLSESSIFALLGIEKHGSAKEPPDPLQVEKGGIILCSNPIYGSFIANRVSSLYVEQKLNADVVMLSPHSMLRWACPRGKKSVEVIVALGELCELSGIAYLLTPDFAPSSFDLLCGEYLNRMCVAMHDVQIPVLPSGCGHLWIYYRFPEKLQYEKGAIPRLFDIRGKWLTKSRFVKLVFHKDVAPKECMEIGTFRIFGRPCQFKELMDRDDLESSVDLSIMSSQGKEKEHAQFRDILDQFREKGDAPSFTVSLKLESLRLRHHISPRYRDLWLHERGLPFALFDPNARIKLVDQKLFRSFRKQQLKQNSSCHACGFDFTSFRGLLKRKRFCAYCHNVFCSDCMDMIERDVPEYHGFTSRQVCSSCGETLIQQSRFIADIRGDTSRRMLHDWSHLFYSDESPSVYYFRHIPEILNELHGESTIKCTTNGEDKVAFFPECIVADFVEKDPSAVPIEFALTPLTSVPAEHAWRPPVGTDKALILVMVNELSVIQSAKIIGDSAHFGDDEVLEVVMRIGQTFDRMEVVGRGVLSRQSGLVLTIGVERDAELSCRFVSFEVNMKTDGIDSLLDDIRTTSDDLLKDIGSGRTERRVPSHDVLSAEDDHIGMKHFSRDETDGLVEDCDEDGGDGGDGGDGNDAGAGAGASCGAGDGRGGEMRGADHDDVLVESMRKRGGYDRGRRGSGGASQTKPTIHLSRVQIFARSSSHRPRVLEWEPMEVEVATLKKKKSSFSPCRLDQKSKKGMDPDDNLTLHLVVPAHSDIDSVWGFEFRPSLRPFDTKQYFGSQVQRVQLTIEGTEDQPCKAILCGEFIIPMIEHGSVFVPIHIDTSQLTPNHRTFVFRALENYGGSRVKGLNCLRLVSILEEQVSSSSASSVASVPVR